MREKIAEWITELITKRPLIIAVVLILLTIFSLWEVQKLKINYNQLDLLPKDIPSVKATEEMINIAGGVGYLIIALKGKDIDHMKAVADDLVAKLLVMEGIQDALCKQDTDFIKKNLPNFIQTADLEEAYKRFRKFIRAMIRKESSFGFSLSDSKNEKLDFSDIIEKYEKYDKRGIDDPYLIDKSKEMLLIIVQPKGNPADIEASEEMLARIQKMIDDYNKNNSRKAVLKEHYKTLAAGASITYGFTGDYKNNIDEAKVISEALAPTSIVAFIAIMLFLIIVLRNFSHIILLMITLVVSVIMTYAFCGVAIGKLNTITSVLGAIIMGFGIDYGLYFIFRMREEFTLTRDLRASIKETLKNAGSASLISVLVTSSSLFILMLSDFKGFSHFGLMAGAGVLITAVMMYITMSLFYVLFDRVWPNFKNNLITKVYEDKTKMDMDASKPFPFAKRILISAAVITIILAVFSTKIAFDYDGRSFMTADSPSVIMQEEVTKRFNIASDPVIIHTKNLEETKAVYDALVPIKENSTIDSVLSYFTLVPPMEQQLANQKILREIEIRLADIKPEMLDKNDMENMKLLKGYLNVKPFVLEDVPKSLLKQFRTSSGGYLTYIYPRISVWDGRELIRFADEVGTIKAGGKIFYSAGGAVIFADLAKIVLYDGKKFSIITAIVVLVLLMTAFKNIRAVAFSVLPLFGGIVWMIGLMAITGWKINFVNIVIFPVVFGIGVSLGVYIYKRYLECGSVLISVKRTGSAIASSAITTLIGWGALLITNHNGLKSMGVLAVFGIAASLVLTFSVLPALLEIANEKQIIKAEEEKGH